MHTCVFVNTCGYTYVRVCLSVVLQLLVFLSNRCRKLGLRSAPHMEVPCLFSPKQKGEYPRKTYTVTTSFFTTEDNQLLATRSQPVTALQWSLEMEFICIWYPFANDCLTT